jgi:hypothetical protein
MKKKLYYTVEKQLQDVGDDIKEATGWKTISLYEITDNEPKKLTDIEADCTDKTTTVIQEWLDENGYSDDNEFEFIEL